MLGQRHVISRRVVIIPHGPHVIRATAAHATQVVFTRVAIRAGHDDPRAAVPALHQGRGAAILSVIVSHCPEPLRIWHDSDRLEQIVARAYVRAGDDAPTGAVPMLNKRLLGRIGIIISDSPHVIRRSGHYAVQSSVIGRTRAGDNAPACSIPVKGERAVAAVIFPVAAHSPHVIRSDGGDSIQVVVSGRVVRTGDDLPTGAVPMLNQRPTIFIRMVADRPRFDSTRHRGHSKEGGAALGVGTINKVPSAAGGRAWLPRLLRSCARRKVQ
ncbi:MAG: hypothetical protein DMF24_05730 [Verrucomicrobia bacterium]|nr:MAG: hypothetical protein DMF24_05730 [Verrucomicrobiota bacterium]